MLRSTPVDVVLAVGDLDTPLVSQLLGTLAHDTTLSRLPVVLLGDAALEAPLVSQMRTGVVEMLLRPFQPFEHPDRVRQVLAELPERTGRVVGFEALRMVEHIQRTFRSGALKLNPGTPGESQALFTHGVLRGAKHREARGRGRARRDARPSPCSLGLRPARAVRKARAPASPSTSTRSPRRAPGDGGERLRHPPGGMRPRCCWPRAAGRSIDVAQGEQLLVMESVTPTPAPPHVPILLVDDDEELCRMFGALFRRKGFDVTTAQDGLAGYEAARRRAPSSCSSPT